jgi:CDP-glycerol glycerophosphotransferase (TagB/SpsB family)
VDDLAWADLVVTEYSTVAVEALALGLPVLSVTLSGRPPLLDFTVPGQAEGVTERSQIAAAVVRLLGASPPLAGSPARQDLLDQLVGPLDDRSASRVGGILSGLLEGTSAA